MGQFLEELVILQQHRSPGADSQRSGLVRYGLAKQSGNGVLIKQATSS